MSESNVLVWDETGNRKYETGVDRGVLYPYAENKPGEGVAWSGLSGVDESPEGADATAVYADNMKYLVMRAAEDYKGTIKAYMYPEEWEACDGSAAPAGTVGLTVGQQTRKTFGLSFRTKIGNDQQFDDYGYKLHLIYGATAAPSDRNYETINDSPEAMELSWEFETIPINVTGFKPFAHMEIDSTKLKTEEQKACLKKLEDILYGSAAAKARLPLPDEVFNIMTPVGG